MAKYDNKMLNIGFNNGVVASRIIAIVNPSSSPMKRLREEARQKGTLIDATQGRKTRSIIIMDSSHIILSAIQAETISNRLADGGGMKEHEKDTKEQL
jgi:extracellular matrix regulatory protein A